ncbi:MAG: hypothetical protein M9949_06255 [Candidatus Kapabacteria bacterium]|nr:hypothetical protein [Candidatus Kapabacteria bacterium]
MPEIITSYKQSYSWTENDFGPTEIIVVVSDAFEGLYAETLTAVNVIELDGIQQSIKGKNGGFEENELTMIISDLLIETVADSDFVQFMKEAESNEVRRFIGVFFDDNTTVNLLFHGTAQREIEAEDLIWHGAHFNASPNPKRKLNFKVSPYRESVFGAFTVTELTEGRETPAIPGFDSSWEAANVINGKGYADFSSSPSIYDVRVYQLVNLNEVLRKYADNLEEAIFNTGDGTISIKFDSVELDGNWHPARWNRRTAYGSSTRYVLTPGNPNYVPFEVHNDDFNRLKINPDGKPLTFAVDVVGIPQNSETAAYLKESPFISYGLVKKILGEPQPSLSNDFRFNKIKTFFDLISSLAQNFGLFTKAYWATSTELRISFENRSENVGDVVYLKTSLSGKLQPSGDEISDKKYLGKANYNALEGYDYYDKNNTGDSPVYIKSKFHENQSFENTNTLLLTISPTVAFIYKAIDRGIDIAAGLPHNHYFVSSADGYFSSRNSGQETFGVHTAIYLYVDKYDALDENESEHYYTPAAAMSIKNGAEDLTFHRLADFLNYLYGFDYDAQFYEYTLELPGFHTLSINSSGVSPIWKNHKLHNKLFLDNHWWKITQIKWKFATKSIELLLHSAQKYSFSNPETPVLSTDGVVVEYSPPNIVANSGYQLILLNAAVTKLEVVARLSDGTYTKALPIAAHCQNLAGLALVDGITDEYIQIKTEGEISDESFPDLPINTLMFLRKNDVGINISNIPLTVPTVQEHLYAIIGVYVGFKTIKIFEGFPQQWIYHPIPVEA